MPSHCGIAGNEAADKLAKEALNLRYLTLISNSNLDIKRHLQDLTFKSWKAHWDSSALSRNIGAAMRNIRKSVVHWPWTFIPNNRKAETVLARLRIGHTGQNFSRSRFSNEVDPLCDCGEVETNEHALMECPKYNSEREILRREVLRLRIAFNYPNLLGGADANEALQFQIVKCVISFLTSSDLISRI